MELIVNILAVALGVVIVDFVMKKRLIKEAKQEIIEEMTKMIDNNDEVTLTITRKDAV